MPGEPGYDINTKSVAVRAKERTRFQKFNRLNQKKNLFYPGKDTNELRGLSIVLRKTRAKGYFCEGKVRMSSSYEPIQSLSMPTTLSPISTPNLSACPSGTTKDTHAKPVALWLRRDKPKGASVKIARNSVGNWEELRPLLEFLEPDDPYSCKLSGVSSPSD